MTDTSKSLIEKLEKLKLSSTSRHSAKRRWFNRIIAIVRQHEAAPLFKHGSFTSHSGLTLADKIDCDALTEANWEANAAWFAARMKFGKVVGIPRGGMALAKALERYASEGPVLLVDDVLTTGRSMEEARKEYPDAIGAVLFSRTRTVPEWITPRFVEQAEERGEISGVVDEERLINLCGLLADLVEGGRPYLSSMAALIRPYLRTTEPVELAQKNAAEILANFKSCEAHTDGTIERQLEEWQACYAMLFTQMNDLVQSRKQESVTPEELLEILRDRVHWHGLNGLNVANDLLERFEIRRVK